MALIGNYTFLAQTPGRSYGGGATGEGMNRGDFNKSSSARNFYFGWAGVSPNDSHPRGLTPGNGAWQIAYKAGGIGSTMRIVASSDVGIANLAGGLGADADLSGLGEITDAAAQLVVSAVAALAGAASFTGDIEAPLEAVAALAGSGNITDAAAFALAWIESNLTGLGTISDATSSGPAEISANVLPYTDLSPQALADAVWSTNMAPGGSPTYPEPGTAGFIITMLHWMQNGKLVTDPATGQMTVYNDDGDPVGTFAIYEDADGTIPYSGNGVEYREARA
jgi:hypothetical protein